MLLPFPLLAAIWLLAVLALPGCAPASVPETPTPPEVSPTPPAPTATFIWFPATGTPTIAPSPVASVTPQRLPEPGAVLLEDDFSDPQAWVTGRTAAGSVAFGQNELTLAVSAPRGYVYSLRKDTSLSNFYLEIAVAPALCRGSDSYGLLLRASAAPDFYRWLLSCDGHQRLERVRGGAVALLQDWIPREGNPLVTHLSAWASAGELRFFVNGIYQFSARDPVLASGTLGVFARAAGETALTVNFSGLTVRAATPDSATPAITTPTPVSRATPGG